MWFWSIIACIEIRIVSALREIFGSWLKFAVLADFEHQTHSNIQVIPKVAVEKPVTFKKIIQNKMKVINIIFYIKNNLPGLSA